MVIIVVAEKSIAPSGRDSAIDVQLDVADGADAGLAAGGDVLASTGARMPRLIQAVARVRCDALSRRGDRGVRLLLHGRDGPRKARWPQPLARAACGNSHPRRDRAARRCDPGAAR